MPNGSIHAIAFGPSAFVGLRGCVAVAQITVVVNTYEGADVLPRALRSVASQDLSDAEVIVADDGSRVPPGTFLAPELLIDGMRIVTQPNGGLSASRNLGIASSSGEYLLFLDDDDELAPGGLSELRRLLRPGVGVASGVAEISYAGTDQPSAFSRPRDQGAEVDHQVACNLAGSFLIARDVLEAVGNFDPDVRCNHQRELLLRALPWCSAHDRQVVSTQAVVVRTHRLPPSQRPRNDPRRLQTCLELILDKHEERLALNPRALSSTRAVAGVAAARADDYSAARRHLLASWRVRPTEWRSLARCLLATCPPLGRRVWSSTRDRDGDREVGTGSRPS